MAAVFQTPGTWVLAGGGAFWSAECRAALAACGINPDGFGTYKQRLDAQGKMREGYQKQRIAEAESGRTPQRPHEPACVRSDPGSRESSHVCSCHEGAAGFNDFLMGTNGAPPNPTGSMQNWLTATSQSGHISGNAFYQDSGARGDPCANTRPTGYDPATGRYANTGGYGYEDKRAFCMDHYGRANDVGTAHNQITRREESQSAAAIARGAHDVQGPGFRAQSGTTGIPVTQREMEAGARATAEIATRGANSRVNNAAPAAFPDAVAPLSPQQRQGSDALTEVQRQNARQLVQREAASGNVAAQQALAGASPNSPSGMSPTAAQQEKAVECIVAAWKQSLKEMRDEAINKHSTVGKSAQAKAAVAAYNRQVPAPNPKARGYTDLPPDRRAAVDAAVGNRPQQRQAQLEALGAQSAGARGKERTPPVTNPERPTPNECREYQANWLLTQRTSHGNYPPMQGSPQNCDGPGPFPPNQQAQPPGP
jgi:hypothetical protein